MAIGPDGKPGVAWYNASSGIFDIYVKHWDGSAWAELGSGSASGGGISHNPDDSLDPFSWLSAPTASRSSPGRFRSSGSSYEIYVRHWNGSAWAGELAGSASGGGVSKNAGESAEPFLAIDHDGKPVVAWQDNSGGNGKIYVRRWNGTAWVELAGSASGGGISKNAGDSKNPSLAIASDGNPVVAWERQRRQSGDLLAPLERLSLGRTGRLGHRRRHRNTGHLGNWSRKPSLAIAPGGAPVVAWEHFGGNGFEIYVRRWNGSAWAEFGRNRPPAAASATMPATPLSLPWPSAPTARRSSPGMIRAMATTTIVLRPTLEQRGWVEVGTGSATGGGISHSNVDAMHPSLAISPNGDPVVAWNDGTNLTNKWDIYVRRYSPAPMPFKALIPAAFQP